MAVTANRYLILFLLFAAASISYAIGFIIGFWLFIAFGVVFELVFWLELFSANRRRSQTRKLYENQLSELESWECSSCSERNPNSFEVCWNCSSERTTR
jgi:uncharacterized protein (DUF58 family)